MYEYKGEKYTLKDLEKIYNIKSHTIYERMSKGKNINEALVIPLKIKHKICQFDKEMRLIKVYDTLAKAEKQTHIPNTNIASCCKGKRKTAGGYIWQYQENA